MVICVPQQTIYARKIMGVYRALPNMAPNVGVAAFKAWQVLRVGIAVFTPMPQIIPQQLLVAAAPASAPFWREAYCATCKLTAQVCVNAKTLLRALLPMMLIMA